MRFGDIIGKRVIYDDKGELILKKEEKLIIKEKWSWSLSEMTTEYTGTEILMESDGVVYLTNKRLVFIREPPTNWRLLGESPLSAGRTISYYGRVKKLREMNGREFVEINLEDIYEINEGFGNAAFVSIEGRETNYDISIPKKISRKILETLVSKKNWKIEKHFFGRHFHGHRENRKIPKISKEEKKKTMGFAGVLLFAGIVFVFLSVIEVYVMINDSDFHPFRIGCLSVSIIIGVMALIIGYKTFKEIHDFKMPESNKEEEFVSKGLDLVNIDNYEEALKYFDKALEINPKNSLAWHSKGVMLVKLGKNEEAIKCYDKALETDTKNADIWFNKGVALNKLKRYEEAIKSYDKAIEINDKYEDALVNKATILGVIGKKEDCIKLCDKVLEINPKNDLAWYNRGYSFECLEKYGEAIRCYKKVLEINPYDKEVKEDLRRMNDKIKWNKKDKKVGK